MWKTRLIVFQILPSPLLPLTEVRAALLLKALMQTSVIFS
jgi:hypothetical protein